MAGSGASGPAGGPSPPLRTTKETHPNLPPGLILDADGKVCKVCNSWRDWGKLQKVPASSSSPSDPTAKTKTKGNAVAAGMGGFAAFLSPAASSSSSSSKSSAAAAAAAAPSSSISPSTSSSDYTPSDDNGSRIDCPPDTVALGRSTWTFLHTTAAYYPIRATPTHQLSMLRLLRSVSLLYPCGPCASDFKDDLESHPPDLTGREGLSRWLCERHNEVNRKLGKEEFECTWEKIDTRWKDGPRDGSCD